MTEEKIKELLKNRYKGEAVAILIVFAIIDILLYLFAGAVFGTVSLVFIVYYFIKAKIEENKKIKNVDNDLLFLIYDDKNVLIKVMDEVINHPIYKVGTAKISKHFILYGDEYENIIRLCDVSKICNTKLNDIYNRIDIEDRFGQKKKIKLEKEKASEVYEYLSENCKNASLDSVVDFNDGVDRTVKQYIKYDHELTEEYCFYDDKPKKSNKESIKENDKTKEVKKEKVKTVSKSIKEKKSSSFKNKEVSVDKKYNDLKKLKELLDDDIITKEEYEKEKSKVLSD